MRAPLKFRHRIGVLVALAAAGLIAATAVAVVLGRDVAQQLEAIETRYVPLVELDRDLKTLFAKIPRALEDAAGAAEDSKLRDADAMYGELLARLHAGRPAIVDNGGDPGALDAELRAYYARAREIAAALVAGTPASQLATEIESMASAQQAVTGHLDLATTPDRRRLASAFAGVRASQRHALWLDIAVACGALVLIGLVSWRLIRYTVTTLRAVTVGVERLARGDVAHEIEVRSHDELGALAREANRTAMRLRDYREQVVAAQRLLEDRATELVRANRYKSEFLASMSHELRTPLNSVMILSSVLAENRDHNLTDKQIEFATLIHRSGEELLALINEVLDLSKIEAGKQALEYEAMPTLDLLDYIRRMFQPLALQKNLAFGVDIAGDLPAEIRTDRARLAQIVKNLISNALKFTERGGVTVRVSRSALAHGHAPASGEAIEIAVSDTGIGVATEQHAWIFEAFAQADAGISRRFGGTGLGLTIAKQLAIRLGGDLTVKSALGAGSTFTLVLPIAGPAGEVAVPRAAGPLALPPLADARGRTRDSAAPVIAETVRAPTDQPDLDGKTVMIVDDDMRSLYQLSSALRGRRMQVITAADGQEALHELDRNARVDLVLIDLMMSHRAGYEAARQIRGVERFRDLPIIALTKPVDLAHLLGVLRDWLA